MQMIKYLCLLVLMMTTSMWAYHIKVDNQTPFKIKVECNLIAWSNKSTTIEPYNHGEVNTIGWLTREVYIHVFDKTGREYNKLITFKNTGVHGIRDTQISITSATLKLVADPVIKNGKVDSASLTLIDLTSDTNPTRFFSSKKQIALK